MAKLELEFSGFTELIDRLKKLEGDAKKTAEEALIETHRYITPNLHKLMVRHERTGKTADAIVDKPVVEWNGDVASVNVGFDINHGGLASIFLMYGTPAHEPNHPGTKRDRELYNAVYGAETKRRVREIQEDVFYAEIRRLEK